MLSFSSPLMFVLQHQHQWQVLDTSILRFLQEIEPSWYCDLFTDEFGQKEPHCLMSQAWKCNKEWKGRKKRSRALCTFLGQLSSFIIILCLFYSENERSSAVHHHYLVGCLCPSFFYLQQVQLRGAKICMLWKQHNLDLFFASNAVWQPAFFLH